MLFMADETQRINLTAEFYVYADYFQWKFELFKSKLDDVRIL